MSNTLNISARERLLKSASELFHAQGYHATGINQIIENASVAKATLYQHFKTKEALCIEFLQVRHTYWMDKHLNYIATHSDKVLASFDFIQHMNEKENFRGCCFLNLLSEFSNDKTEIIAVLQHHKKDLQNRIYSFFNADNEELAYHVYCLLESAIIESQLFKSQEPILRLKPIVQSLLKRNDYGS